MLCLLFSYVCTLFVSSAAEEETHSDVLNDLRFDETFDINDYPSVANDYSLSVISIAEGDEKELYLYVYQPSHDTLNLEASTVLLYDEFVADPNDEFHPKRYFLELVSTYGVFDKYLVKGYEVSDEPYRYYNIVSLYRPFNSQIDTSSVATTEIAYNVGQQWCVYYFNDVIHYEKSVLQTLELEYTLNSFVRFFDGITLGSLGGVYTAGDAHFVCFNALNYQIEHIYDADISFKTRDVSINSIGDTYGDWSEVQYKYLSEEDNVTFEGAGLGGKKYKWNRIMSAEDFVQKMDDQDVSWIDADRDTILKSQWVFAFVETPYDSSSSGALYQFRDYVEVGSVGVLRIKFHDTTSKIYNLGVVGDITSSQTTPSGVGNPDLSDILEWIQFILFAVIAVAVISLVSGIYPIVKDAFLLLFNFVSEVINTIINIITWPYRLITGKPKRKRSYSRSMPSSNSYKRRKKY